jgi:DNA-binding NarL/FixJ family response regulator
MRPVLSRRERQVLRLLAFGATNKQLASRLCLSQQTIKNHVTSILRKLNVDTRLQAALYAIKSGMVSLDDL